MKKNIKDSSKSLKDVLNSLLSSKKLMAAVLAPLALSLVACPSGNDDNGVIETPEEVKEISRVFDSITVVDYSGSAKTKQDILDELKLRVKYMADFTDNTTKAVYDNINYKDLDEHPEIPGNVEVTISSDTDEFPKDKENVKLTVTYNGNIIYTTDIKNGNYYAGQGGKDPETPNYKDVKAVLKEILGDKYEAISGEVSQNITLTAQTIDAVTDIFPDLESVVSDSNKMTAAKTKVDKSTDDVKKALVAQVEEKISVTRKAKQYKVISGKSGIELNPVTGSGYEISAEKGMKVSLKEEFKYFSNHIESLSDNIDISGITISSQQDVGDIHYDAIPLIPGEDLKEEIYNKLNLEGKNPESLPTLSFGIGGDKELGLKHFLDIYDKYNKSKKLDLLNDITATFGSMDGRTLVDGVKKENYTLFKDDGNTAKDHNDTSIRSFNIDDLVEFTNKYNISDIRNLIISGDATTEGPVDWRPTNIIFEGDVSKLKNSSERVLNGIVYFKDLPYNNKDVGGQGINGAVKLNKLEGLKNFKINDKSESQELTHNKSVVDLRGINKDKMEKYNPSYEDRIFKWIGAVYFAGDVKTLAENDKLYTKFINYECSEYINNEYFGDSVRKNSIGYDKDNPTAFTTSKTARKLSEFEYFGNNRYYEESAKDSYKENLETNNFEGLNLLDIQIERLKNSNNNKTIAKVDFVDPDTQKIILSVLNDRQYNT